MGITKQDSKWCTLSTTKTLVPKTRVSVSRTLTPTLQPDPGLLCLVTIQLPSMAIPREPTQAANLWGSRITPVLCPQSMATASKFSISNHHYPLQDENDSIGTVHRGSVATL